ncbi:MAG: RagB/SusD family nutrient uptake outer membrane protein [Bacteroidales bacterium]|nr:RagB/SusD family nutrient uptake outer membrane protein [Bacteroidales bacterium]
MKNIYSILTIMITMAIFTSCEDFLVENPSYALPSNESVKTVTDLQNAVNGVYARISYSGSLSFYAGDFIALGDLRADDMTYNDQLNANAISPVARFQYDKNSAYSENFWSAPYTTLGRINDILSVTDNLTVLSGEEDTFTDLVGQLYGMRALCHFDLVRTFAQLPKALHDGMTLNTPDGGIPIADQVFPVEYKPVRNTIGEVYDFILADFDRAISRLNPAPAIANSYGALNIWAARALKARAQLYYGNYPQALSLAEEVINGAGASGFRLAEFSEITSIWNKVQQPEFLFELIVNVTYNAQRNSIGYYSNPDGYGEFVLSENFYNYLLFDNPADFRKFLAVEKSSQQGTGTDYYPLKYPGREVETASGGMEVNTYVNNPRVIRMAEVYLIASEAGFHDGNQTKAAEHLNALRSKRIAGVAALTTVTLDDILNERRKELFAEGHRSWDVWRNKRSLVNDDFGGATVNYDNYRTLVPIPQRETDISPDLKQNPEW